MCIDCEIKPCVYCVNGIKYNTITYMDVWRAHVCVCSIISSVDNTLQTI